MYWYFTFLKVVLSSYWSAHSYIKKRLALCFLLTSGCVVKQSSWNPRSEEASLPFDKFGLKSRGLPEISVLSWEAYILRFPLPPSSCWTGKWVSSLIPPKTLLRRHMCMCGRFYCRLWRCRSYIATQGPLRTKGHSLKPLCHAGPAPQGPQPPSSLAPHLSLQDWPGNLTGQQGLWSSQFLPETPRPSPSVLRPGPTLSRWQLRL